VDAFYTAHTVTAGAAPTTLVLAVRRERRRAAARQPGGRAATSARVGHPTGRTVRSTTTARGAPFSDLARRPFAAPEAAHLAELGPGPRQIAAAVRAEALLRLADTVVLAADAVDVATSVLVRFPSRSL
jgi:selenocysteine-specific elongation factor